MYTFKCLLRNDENTRVYDGTHLGVDLPLSDSIFFICSVDRNSMMPWHNSYSSVHFCNSTGLLLPSVMWTKSLKKKGGIAVNYLFILIYTNCTNTQQQQQRKREKKKRSITMTVTLWLGRWFFIFFNLPRPSHFPGMNNVYCYCCFDSISSRTDLCILKCVLKLVKAIIEFLNRCSFICAL